MSKDNTAFWGIVAIIGAGLAVAAGSSREKDSLLKNSRADNVIRILGNGVIFLDETQVTLDDIALTTKLLNAAILIPHDLEDFQTGKQTLERVQQLLRNKSIPFEIVRYFRFQSSDQNNFVSEVAKRPIQITLTDSDLALNAFDHKTEEGEKLGILWAESKDPRPRQLLSSIEGGIYSDAEAFYNFVVEKKIFEATIEIPEGRDELFGLFLSEAPSSIAMITEDGISLTENSEVIQDLLIELTDKRKELKLLEQDFAKIEDIQSLKSIVDEEIFEAEEELEKANDLLSIAINASKSRETIEGAASIVEDLRNTVKIKKEESSRLKEKIEEIGSFGSDSFEFEKLAINSEITRIEKELAEIETTTQDLTIKIVKVRTF